MIFKALSSNSTLKVFDISWNSVGSGTPSAAPVICEFFKTNKSMVHMDLSNNNISFEETQEIAKVLNQYNKSIYGLHYVGNFGYFSNEV